MEISFSVVIPVYNRQDTIYKCVQSAMGQSYRPAEIIVVDDGSTDETANVVSSIESKNIPIILHQQANSERGAARNRGMEIAKSNYIVFLDSDDYMLPEYLSDVKNYVLAQPKEPEIIAMKLKVFNGTEYSALRSQEKLRGIYTYSVLLKGNPFACHFAIRKSSSTHPFIEDRSVITMEDWLFLLQNSINNPIHVLDKYGVIFNQHDGRSMQDDLKVIQARKNALDWIESNLKLSTRERIKVNAHSALFCAIHYTNAGMKGQAIVQLYHAMLKGIFNTIWIYTLLRNLISKRTLESIKSVFH